MTDESLWQQGLAEFRDNAANDRPTPGGGSVAAVTGTLGLSLVLMALRVTAKKPGRREALVPLIEAALRLMPELAGHADADVAAFQEYMAAVRLPRATEDETAARASAIGRAARTATEMPLNAAQSMLEGLGLARQAAAAVSPAIISDAGAGAALLHGALTALLLTVDANLGLLPDTAPGADYRVSRRHLQQAADGQLAAIRSTLAERLGTG